MSCDFAHTINETKWLTQLPILMQSTFGGKYKIPDPPTSPSLISLNGFCERWVSFSNRLLPLLSFFLDFWSGFSRVLFQFLQTFFLDPSGLFWLAVLCKLLLRLSLLYQLLPRLSLLYQLLLRLSLLYQLLLRLSLLYQLLRLKLV